MEKLQEECGVFGIYNNDTFDCAKLSYYALYALQHRGQQSCGIAINDNGTIINHKDIGIVSEVFDEVVLKHLSGGKIGLAQCRYSQNETHKRENAQPLTSKYVKGSITIAYNGVLINKEELREELEQNGAIFQSGNACEIMAYLIARERLKTGSIEEAILGVMPKLKGAFSVLVMSPQKLLAFRDPNGMKPLALGKVENSYLLASETCAFDSVGGSYVRDLKPGELIMIDKDGVHTYEKYCGHCSNMCVFEYIYFARPDSLVEGSSVYQARKEAGRILAQEHPVDADLVIGVPDSGLYAAIGYAEESGIPYGMGFIKNKYIGRTFIQPLQSERENSVRIKLNALKSAVKGKRIIMVDDSIVRGTTCKHIVTLLREAGAVEVHVRISSPPFLYPCYFGTDVPSSDVLVACNNSMEEICELIGADSLGYLSIDGVNRIVGPVTDNYCKGCFTGKYQIPVK